jgi:hypothetical protein
MLSKIDQSHDELLVVWKVGASFNGCWLLLLIDPHEINPTWGIVLPLHCNRERKKNVANSVFHVGVIQVLFDLIGAQLIGISDGQ